MAERDVAFLNARRDGGGHDKRMINEAGEFAAGAACPGDSDHAAFARGLDPFEHVRRIAAGADADGDIALLAMSPHLSGEEFVVSVVVGDTGDGGDVGGKRDSRQRCPFPFVAADEFRRDMRGVRGAAAVSKEQHFPSFTKCGDHEAGYERNAIRVVTRELLLDGRAVGKCFEDKVFHQWAILGKRGETVKPGGYDLTFTAAG